MFLLEWSLCWIFKRETSGGLRGGGGGEGEGKERTTPLSYGLNCVSYSPQSSSEIKSKMLHHTFLYISFPSLLDYDVKMPWKCLIFVLWRTVNKLLFGPKKSTPRKFAYISHFQWIGINATKFEKREFVLKVTLSSVAVVDAKAPYYGEYTSGDQFKLMFKLARLAKSHVNKVVCN